MKLADWILIAGIAVVLVAAGRFIYRAKKSGKKCIGCPNSGSCTCGCDRKP